MIESWRTLLYFPLGMIPSIFFAMRILVQWYQTEKRKTSYVGIEFWKLSLWGNLFLVAHYLIQVQYPFALIQGINAVISWRNINFINPRRTYKRNTVIAIGVFASLLITLMFLAQSYFIIGKLDWIRSPQKPFDPFRQSHALIWHIFGAIGSIVFASRFWVQWWLAEQSKKSELGPLFWYLSIVGSSMLIVYAVHISDHITLFYNFFGMIPYLRNIFFLRRAKD